MQEIGKEQGRTLRAVAERYGVSYNRMRDEASSGRLEVRKIGQRFVVTERAERRWAEKLPKLVCNDG